MKVFMLFMSFCCLHIREKRDLVVAWRLTKVSL
jgi:hypothetical protein